MRIIQFKDLQQLMQNNLKRKAEELWSYLPHVPNTTKKPNPIIKRKSEVTDKEVLNLTGGLFPLKLVDTAKQNNMISQQFENWVYVPIRQRNPNIGKIYHWVKQGEEEKIYHGDKFNIEPDITQFSEQQYNGIAVDHEAWPYSQVVQIFQKLKVYNFNFIVVQDRLSSNRNWTVEDLKQVSSDFIQIYFTVTRLIVQARGEKDTVRSNYIFDKKYEINRKFELQKYMMRSKVDTDREKYLINEIRRLDVQIKKQEREQINLKKVLKLDQVPEQLFKLKQNTDMTQILKNQKVYTRQQLLIKPIVLPGKIEEKLKEVLDGLNIPEKIIATKQNAELYDNLRKKILIMLSLNRYIRKRENERKSLEDKKKRVMLQQQEQRNNKSLNPLGTSSLGQPKKKQKV